MSRAAAVLVVASGLALPVCAADPISKAEYQATRKNIESDFRGARIGCEPMPDKVQERCLADVAARQAVALAELEALYQPGPKTRAELRLARALASHASAVGRCDEKPGRVRDACLKEADEARAAARAEPVAAATRPGSR
jgi:hypothetical protein